MTDEDTGTTQKEERMHLESKRPLAVGLSILAVALAGAGTAAACDGGGSGTRTAEVKAAHYTLSHRHGWWAGGLVRTAAAYFGITPSQLKAQLASGKSLAQIAPAGTSASLLSDALLAAVKTKLDAAVANGRITSAQESEWLAKLSAKLSALVNMLWTKTWVGDHDAGWAWHR